VASCTLADLQAVWNMSEPLKFHFDVDGSNFTSAGEASVQIKQKLRQLGFAPES
jgi:hypothetical protein